MAENYPFRHFSHNLFLGSDNYNRWKGRMELYLAKEPYAWRVLQNGPYMFLNENSGLKDVDKLTPDELVTISYNNIARNTIMTGLSLTTSDKVSSCTTFKEMWNSVL